MIIEVIRYMVFSRCFLKKNARLLQWLVFFLFGPQSSPCMYHSLVHTLIDLGGTKWWRVCVPASVRNFSTYLKKPDENLVFSVDKHSFCLSVSKLFSWNGFLLKTSWAYCKNFLSFIYSADFRRSRFVFIRLFIIQVFIEKQNIEIENQKSWWKVQISVVSKVDAAIFSVSTKWNIVPRWPEMRYFHIWKQVVMNKKHCRLIFMYNQWLPLLFSIHIYNESFKMNVYGKSMKCTIIIWLYKLKVEISETDTENDKEPKVFKLSMFLCNFGQNFVRGRRWLECWKRSSKYQFIV